ncbi:MAG: hypothetical protein HUU43_10335 [Ignavibacteriaceae bacterium]|nr:hypothetical protein [Ignavibacteriaceae bacterium]
MQIGFGAGILQRAGVLFSPKSVPNLELWLDASDIATITKDGSNCVSEWRDKSGNARHAVQGTALNQPLWIETGKNGKATIRFDGSTDFFDSITTNKNLGTFFFVSNGSKGTGLFNNVGRLFSKLFPNEGVFAFGNSASALTNETFTVSNNSSTSYLSTNTPIDSLSWKAIGFTTTSIYINNATANIIRSDLDSGNLQVDLMLGKRGTAAQYYTGDIAEVLFYNRTLTADEITRVSNYLVQKWGL